MNEGKPKGTRYEFEPPNPVTKYKVRQFRSGSFRKMMPRREVMKHNHLLPLLIA
jgi:hypothetical protein